MNVIEKRRAAELRLRERIEMDVTERRLNAETEEMIVNEHPLLALLLLYIFLIFFLIKRQVKYFLELLFNYLLLSSFNHLNF